MVSILDTIGEGYRPGQPLTKREREVIILISLGHADKDIAAILDISARTVQTYVTRIVIKLQTANRTHAACRFLASEPRETLINLGFVQE
jgi:non-specific serine/threonine protein kinase